MSCPEPQDAGKGLPYATIRSAAMPAKSPTMVPEVRLMLMARSGHMSVRSFAKYARVSAEALARHQAERDPARRR